MSKVSTPITEVNLLYGPTDLVKLWTYMEVLIMATNKRALLTQSFCMKVYTSQQETSSSGSIRQHRDVGKTTGPQTDFIWQRSSVWKYQKKT
jgi:hypothetical protein